MPEGRGSILDKFVKFLLILSFRPHYGPGIDSTDNLTTFTCPYFRISGSRNLLDSYEPVQACVGKALPFAYKGSTSSLMWIYVNYRMQNKY
jgi:hypothetical protein